MMRTYPVLYLLQGIALLIVFGTMFLAIYAVGLVLP